jgi:ribonuclease P protein component
MSSTGPARQVAPDILFYETPISTVENPPQAAARLSKPEFHQKRPRHIAQSPSRGPQAPDPGLSRAVMAATPKRLPLSRAQRLKQSRDFARVRQAGQRLVQGCLIVNWMSLPPGSASHLGVVTSGKIGNAVVRSRVRRLLRESFRLHQHELTHPLDLVLVARPSITGRAFAEVERDFLTTVRRAGLLQA